MSAPLKLQNPKDRRPPSERDQEIYRLCKAQRVPQKQVAQDYKIGAPRVSQIVKKVREWLANASAKDGELDCNQERRLERRIERERLEHLYGQSLRMLEDFEKPSESTRGEGEGAVKTTREERNARVQALKSCTRIAESLGKIAEREPLPEPARKGASGFIRFDHLQEELIRRRIEAEEHGKAPVSGDPYLVMWFLLRMMFGDPVKPLVPGSPLQGAMRKIVETLVEAGAVGQEPVASRQLPEGGCVVAATTQSVADGMASDPLCEAAAATHSHPGNSRPNGTNGAKVTKLAGYSLLDGCDPEILQDIVANGWLERFKDGGAMHQESLVAASLARENSGEFSAEAAGSKVQSPRSKVADAGSVVAATTQSVTGAGQGGCVVAATTQGVAGEPAQGPLCSAAAAKHSHPPEVGSPEWQVARAKWLKERDERVARERMQKIQERLDRDEDLRQRRAAAAARRRWLEAGQCQY
jgi:hypothetical protein